MAISSAVTVPPVVAQAYNVSVLSWSELLAGTDAVLALYEHLLLKPISLLPASRLTRIR